MNFLNNHRRTILLGLIDTIICILAGILSFLLIRYFEHWDYLPIKLNISSVMFNTIGIALATMFGFFVAGVYKCIWRYAKVREYVKCCVGVAISAVFYCVGTIVLRYNFSRIYICMNYLFLLIGVCASRAMYATIYEIIKNKHTKKRIRTMIVGAGHSGNKVIMEMLSGDSSLKPVLAVDDDVQKFKKNINGIEVLGTTKDIPRLVEQYRIKMIFFTIPSCTADDKRRILNICSETVCEVKVIPPIYDLMVNSDFMGQAKPINTEDLLGRDVITFENYAVSNMIKGRVCMVTGGGGSIGSELCRQIAKFSPKKLVIVDIYENNAYDIQQELLAEHKDINLDVRIASVRDYDKMDVLFDKFRPDLVFHAAAHKHVPLMETSPEEAIKNNVGGTYNIAYLSNKYNVKKFVLVSTDKAVNPTNVMGATKRCCEMIAQYFAQISQNTEFVAVRFGNVLGSNGSVIPLFEKQIAAGGPITVTHPDIIRYFMTIPEAVSLILQAGTMARGGEIFVLDMGEPVKIVTLAENLIKLHGKEPYVDVDIQFTGLRPGEKLFEELLMSEEGIKETANKKIFIGTQIQIDANSFEQTIKDIEEIAYSNNSEDAIEALRRVVPTFNHAIVK